VLGTANVIAACQAAGVARCVVISHRQSLRGLTAYGASKRLAEALVTAAPASPTICHRGALRQRAGSNGSVIPLWRDQAARGLPLTITDAAVPASG
jgi:UDP-N-acetylglucosamine 4,6-dehydratase